MSSRSYFIAALGLSAAALSGCANHFVSSFRPVPGYTDSIPGAETDPAPRLILTADLKGQIDQLKQGGYTEIGTSGFNHDWKPRRLLRKDAVREARYLGAEVVVMRKVSAPVPDGPDPTVAPPADPTAQEFRYFAVFLKHPA